MTGKIIEAPDAKDACGLRRVAWFATSLREAKHDAFDRPRMACRLVRINENRVHSDIALRHRKSRRHSIEEALDDSNFVHANDGIMRARHSDVGDIGRTSRKHALIGSGYVRVRSEHHGNFAVEKPTHGLLF